MTREEAIKEIQSWTPALLSMGSKCTESTAEAQTMAIEALKEPKQGEWIRTGGDTYGPVCKCSICGSDYHSYTDKFCSECGAKMTFYEE